MRIIRIIQKALPLIGFSCFALSAIAQAPVSDLSTPQSRAAGVSEGYAAGSKTYGASTTTSSTDGGTDSGNMFRQYQQLQAEVSALRGQLEEQAYELQKLKQQHQEDFASLDRRLSGGSAPSGSSTAENPAAPINASSAVQPPVSPGDKPGNTDGREEYEAAYGLLKEKNYSGASAAFKAFVAKYPDSEYAGNSWFWLGFVYQTQGDTNSAGAAFSSLIERFPSHSKTDDAKYNLGKIYNQQGKTDQARTLLKEVAAGNSKSAPLAKSYLESM